MKLTKKTVHSDKDIFTAEKRSQIMSAVKAKNTKFERDFFRLLRKRGLRFRTHYQKVIGKPDIAIPAPKIAVFLDSNFWHVWQYTRWSDKLTSTFWKEKIKRNIQRDRKVSRQLKKDGWIVLRFWEHMIKLNPDAAIDKILTIIYDKRRNKK